MNAVPAISENWRQWRKPRNVDTDGLRRLVPRANEVDDPVLTLVEIAERLKVPVSTARKMVASSVLRGLKLGNHWRVFESDLVAYLQHQRAKTEKSRPHLLPPVKKRRFS